MESSEKKPLIIAIHGQARRGKDTIGRHLEDYYGFRPLHWAYDMYDECRHAHIVVTSGPGGHQDSVSLNGDTYMRDEHPKLYGVFYEWIKTQTRGEYDRLTRMYTYLYLGMISRDARLLQIWGSDYRRSYFGEEYFVRKVDRTIEKFVERGQERFCICDTRFPNELTYPRERGGYLWRVWSDRPWEDTGRPADHVSETALLHWKDWDEDLSNNGTIPELLFKVDVAMSKIGIERNEIDTEDYRHVG